MSYRVRLLAVGAGVAVRQAETARVSGEPPPAPAVCRVANLARVSRGPARLLHESPDLLRVVFEHVLQ